MSPRKPIDPVSVELRNLKREPVPTSFTLFVNLDMPESQPELGYVPVQRFANCKCNCESALRRFNSKVEKLVASDGVYSLSVMCHTKAAVKAAVRANEKIHKLRLSTLTTDRQAVLKPLILELAGHCEHAKFPCREVEQPHHFVPYPVIPRCQVDENGVALMDSDSGSDEEDEQPGEPVVSNCQAIFAYTTIINNALIEKLSQKLPRDAKQPTSQRPGYIYILKSSHIPNMLKIGVTTKKPPVRQEQWDRCYRTIQLHAYTSPVPYARLVETLIHTELLAQRYMVECTTCKGRKARARSHTEWFKVTEQLAEQVVIRWAKWMGSRPYHADTRKLSLTWFERLKKAAERSYRPGVDYILCQDATWQNFTDMRRPTGARDDSGAVELIRCKNAKSPFSD